MWRDYLDKLLDTGLAVASDQLKDKPNPQAPAPAVAQSKLPSWLVPVGIVAALGVVALLVFRGRSA